MTVRMRHTSSHTKNRRSHHALVEGAIVKDKESGNLRLPHRLDETTGMYRGKQIAAAKAVTKKSKKEGRGERSQVEVADTTPAAQKNDAAAKEAKKEVKKGTTLDKSTKGRSTTRSGFGGGA